MKCQRSQGLNIGSLSTDIKNSKIIFKKEKKKKGSKTHQLYESNPNEVASRG